MRGVGPLANLVLFALLVAGAVWLMWWQSNRLDAGAVATLVGALIGGAAVLLGNAINVFDERARRARQLETRRAVLSVGPVKGLSLRDDFPRQPSLTTSLGPELLILEEPEIDALVTLQENLAITRANLRESADPQGLVGSLRLTNLVEGLAFDMEILARCFERIAPTRRFKLGSANPQLASTILRDAAKSHREEPAE